MQTIQENEIIYLIKNHMIELIEPKRWVDLVNFLYKLMISNEILSVLTPILADIFVFSYPIYLLSLYIWWWYKKNRETKIAALIIWANVAISVIINISIQFFVQKNRPNVVLWLGESHETVLHKFLPNSSFPSDHAAVSMSIAIASILRGIIYKDKKFIRFWVVGIIFSIIMCGARITTAVHRPTDIIWGMLVGIVVPLILILPRPHKQLKTIMNRIAKKI
jgi:membrane-associated phospholipid phosphatase